MANDTGLRVISVDYTLAPHAQWKEITSQVVSVLQALVEEGHALKVPCRNARDGRLAGRFLAVT